MFLLLRTSWNSSLGFYAGYFTFAAGQTAVKYVLHDPGIECLKLDTDLKRSYSMLVLKVAGVKFLTAANSIPAMDQI